MRRPQAHHHQSGERMWGLQTSQQAGHSSATGQLSDLVCTLGRAITQIPLLEPGRRPEGERVSFGIGQGLYTTVSMDFSANSTLLKWGVAPMQCSAMARWQPLDFQAS